jgi:hypothetical protein
MKSRVVILVMLLKWCALPPLTPLALIKALNRLRKFNTLLIKPSLILVGCLWRNVCGLKKLKHLPWLIIKPKSKI